MTKTIIGTKNLHLLSYTLRGGDGSYVYKNGPGTDTLNLNITETQLNILSAHAFHAFETAKRGAVFDFSPYLHGMHLKTMGIHHLQATITGTPGNDHFTYSPNSSTTNVPLIYNGGHGHNTFTLTLTQAQYNSLDKAGAFAAFSLIHSSSKFDFSHYVHAFHFATINIETLNSTVLGTSSNDSFSYTPNTDNAHTTVLFNGHGGNDTLTFNLSHAQYDQIAGLLNGAFTANSNDTAFTAKSTGTVDLTSAGILVKTHNIKNIDIHYTDSPHNINIHHPDPPPNIPTIHVYDASGTLPTIGANSTMNFHITLSQAYSHAVTFDYMTLGTPGPAGDPSTGSSALINPDFANTHGTITINPGQTSVDIPVTIFGSDKALSSSEAFHLELYNAQNATLGTDGTSTATGTITSTHAAQTDGLPILNSLPNSPNIIYLNFLGDSVKGTIWNGDSEFNRGTLNASQFHLPGGSGSTFNADELAFIRNVFDRVSEDYCTFNVNVTTDPNLYNATPTAHRQMALITDSTSVQPSTHQHDFGGVSYVNVYGGGDYYGISWVMYNNLPYHRSGTGPAYAQEVADAISHEIGHSLGLQHHDIPGSGSDYDPGSNNWGSIMGDPYSQSLTQWSNGYSTDAGGVYQDDLYTISNTLQNASGQGYRSDDNYGHTQQTATDIPFDVQNVEGFIGAQNNSLNTASVSNDSDWFKFTTNANTSAFSLKVSPLQALNTSDSTLAGNSTQGNNLLVGATLFHLNNQTLVQDATFSAPNSAPASSATFDNIHASGSETFYLQIFGAANSFTDPNNSYDHSQSNYGSLGYYNLSFT